MSFVGCGSQCAAESLIFADMLYCVFLDCLDPASTNIGVVSAEFNKCLLVFGSNVFLLVEMFVGKYCAST